jgi:hypothetical protein
MSRVRLRTESAARLRCPSVLPVAVLLLPPPAAPQTKPQPADQQSIVPDSAHAVRTGAPASPPHSEVRLQKRGTETAVPRQPEL